MGLTVPDLLAGQGSAAAMSMVQKLLVTPSAPLLLCSPTPEAGPCHPHAAPSLWHACTHMPIGPRPEDGETPTGLGTRFREVIRFLPEVERISQEHGS